MNNLASGFYLGKALSEGDYLGAMPFIPDIINAVKSAAPGLIRETASRKLSALQTKLGVAPRPEYVEADIVQVTPGLPVMASTAPNLLMKGALALAVFFVFRKMLRSR